MSTNPKSVNFYQNLKDANLKDSIIFFLYRHTKMEEKVTFLPGTQVRKKSKRDSIGVVLNQPAKIFDNEKYYPVRFKTSGFRAERIAESDLEIYLENDDIKSLLLSQTYGAKETLSRIITHYKIFKPLSDHIYALFSSKTHFHPYQFKPVLKYLLSHNKRLLLADEVGLGKTIEAGLILTEEMARQEIERVLIVCPSRLRTKWKEEMERRFSLRFDIMEAKRFLALSRDFREKGYPRNLQAICSLEGLHQKKIVNSFEELPPPLDFLIIDEAHHLRNPETLSHKVGLALAEETGNVILATATPIHLGNENLFNILKILEPEQFSNFQTFNDRLSANEHVVEAQRILSEFPANLAKCKKELQKVENTSEGERFSRNPLYKDILKRLTEFEGTKTSHVVELRRALNDINMLSHVINRTRKREAFEKQPKRCPTVISVTFSDEEKEAYDLIVSYVRSRLKITESGAIRFGLTMPQRLAASCLPAALNYYLKKSGFKNAVDGDDVDPEGNTGDQEGFGNNSAEFLSKIGEFSGRKMPDSKFEELLRQLADLEKIEKGRKVIIFSYFISTLKYLSKKLSEHGYTNILIYGGIPSLPEDPQNDERGKRIKEFRHNQNIQILVSSEVGSEGLDFEFAHILFNYDLPWNPMIVEQRIGRVDRFNQKSDRILIFNMSVIGTIEERILDRLYQRIGIFEKSIGDLEPIIGEMMNKLVPVFLTSWLTAEEEKKRIDQAVQVIENERQEMEKLEANRVRFVGHDSFFSDQVNRARSLKLYLSEEELRVFLREYLKMVHPQCNLEENANEKGVCNLTISSDLAREVEALENVRQEYKYRFSKSCDYGLATGDPIPVTFSSEIAYQNAELEYINMHHPLVQLACRHYDNRQGHLHPVAKIAVKAKPDIDLESGLFLYLVYTIESYGFQPGRTLESIFVSLKEFECLNEDKSAMLLAKMVSDGQTFDGIPPVGEDKINKALEIIDIKLDERFRRRKQESEQTNMASIENMRSNIEASHQYKIGRKQELLKRAYDEKRAQRLIRMLEGEIRNLEGKMASKICDLEAKRNLQFSPPKEIAAGVVQIFE